MTQHSTQASDTISGTSKQILNDRFGKRTTMVVTNTSSSAVAWLALGVAPAVVGEGIKLLPNAYFLDSNTTGYLCWNGAVQIVADDSGTVSLHETYED